MAAVRGSFGRSWGRSRRRRGLRLARVDSLDEGDEGDETELLGKLDELGEVHGGGNLRRTPADDGGHGS